MPKLNDITPIIPKIINAIWVGGILNEAGQKNMENWRAMNPDYQMKLWIDTSLYHEDALKDQFLKLRHWAAQHDIQLCDVSHRDNPNYFIQAKRKDILENKPNEKYYVDEINLLFKNYASASDLLRLEILNEGGIYFDAKDVFPKKPLGDLAAPYGFLYNYQRPGRLNNDLLASVPQGEFINMYRQMAYNNYEKLYADFRKLRGHRNPMFTSPFIYNSVHARFQSTLDLAGPMGLRDTIKQFVAEKQLSEEQEAALHFDKAYYDAPEDTALSWVGNALNNYDDLGPIFRNFVREYFSVALEKVSQTHAAASYQQSINKIIKRIDALPPTIPLPEIYTACQEGFDGDTWRELDNVCATLLTTFGRVSKTAETLIHYCTNHVTAENFRNTLKIGIHDPCPEKFELESFINQVLNATEPNLIAFNLFLPKAPPASEPRPQAHQHFTLS